MIIQSKHDTKGLITLISPYVSHISDEYDNMKEVLRRKHKLASQVRLDNNEKARADREHEVAKLSAELQKEPVKYIFGLFTTYKTKETCDREANLRVDRPAREDLIWPYYPDPPSDIELGRKMLTTLDCFEGIPLLDGDEIILVKNAKGFKNG